MAINEKPYLPFEQDLTPELLAQLLALVPQGFDPSNQAPSGLTDAGAIYEAPLWGLDPNNSMSPTVGYGADGKLYISQPRNVSTWGGSDVGGAWDQNGKWLGFGGGATDLRGFGNFILTSLAAGYGADAINGMNAGGTAATTGMSGGELASFLEANAGALAPGGEVAAGYGTGWGVGADGIIGSGATMAADGTALNQGFNVPNGSQEPVSNMADPMGQTPGGTPTGQLPTTNTPTTNPPTTTAPGTAAPGTTTPPGNNPATGLPWTDIAKGVVTAAGVGQVAGNNGPDTGDLKDNMSKPGDIAAALTAGNQQNWQSGIDQTRYDVVGPNGSSTWSSTPVFNQAGFDSAMAQWTAAGDPNLPKPTEQQFTTQKWTNTATADPAQQKLYDTNLGNSQQAADYVGTAQTNYANQTTKGVDRSGIPGYNFDPKVQEQKQIDQSALPTYQNVRSRSGDLTTPQYGQVNRGDIQTSVDPITRDRSLQAQALTGNVANSVGGWSDQLARMNPWEYDQQGSDAMYRQQTRYLLPQQEANKRAIESRLGEQGFVPGTPAYDSAYRQMMDSNAQALQQARDVAITSGREFGNQAFDNRTDALKAAIAGMLDTGTLGVNTGRLGLDSEKAMFDSRLDVGKFGNDAQKQDFDQQMGLTERVRQTGLDANQVIKDAFGMDADAASFNNKWAQQGFGDIRDLFATNNAAIEGNNAANVAGMNATNAAVTSANQTANDNFTTDNNALAKLLTTAYNQSAPPDQLKTPGPGISDVGQAGNVDINKMLKDWFDNNADIFNSETSSSNAQTAAIGQLLTALLTGWLK